MLKDVSFDLVEGERAGVVGVNGSGKSTLLKILSGGMRQDAGSVTWVRPGLRLAFLSQEEDWLPGIPISSQIGEVPPATLRRCGLDQAILCRTPDSLSGGQKTRAALARVLAQDPDVLLLDEPTNHLDYEGLEWIEKVIESYPGTVLVVSHDRYFLDRVAGRILELDGGLVIAYNGNYSEYAALKRAERERAEAEYLTYVKEKKRLQEAIRREAQWAAAAHRTRITRDMPKNAGVFARGQAKAHSRIAASMEKRLDRMRVEKPRKQERISLAIEDGRGRLPRNLIVAEDAGFTFDGNRWVIRGARFCVRRGDRVAVIGPNGAGKTTLIRLIAGELEPSEGSIATAKAQFAFLAQESQQLSPFNAVIEEAASANPSVSLKEVRGLLGCLLFRGDDVLKPVGVLSAGERIRLGLVKILLRDPDVVVLDEPTNGLDLPSCERLEEALLAYEGTLLIASHDRYLLSRVTDSVISIENGRVESYAGGYREFRERKAATTDPGPAERRLLLEARLAWLSGELASAGGANEELNKEFISVSRELRALKGG